MTSFQIREAQVQDCEAIARYSQDLAWETEHIKLPWARIHQGVLTMITDKSCGFYLVAEVDEANGDKKVIGMVGATYEWSDWRNGRFWWLQSVYIHPECRNKGIFRALYNEMKLRCKQDPNSCGLRLYVEKENQTANAVYKALGMHQAEYDVMEVEFVLDRNRSEDS